MLFQALDNKNECVGIYADGDLVYDGPLSGLTRTWSYSAFLEDAPVEYASLYCAGKTIEEMCPEELREKWSNVSERMRAYLRSFSTAKLSLEQNCFFDLVPERYLMELCEVKNQISEHILTTVERPHNYEHLLEVTKLIAEIGHQPLNIVPKNIGHMRARVQARALLKHLARSEPYCKYNLAGTRTGRLTVKSSGFPILTLNRDFRAILEPQNDWFVELDYNAAELRVLLALLDKKQPTGDIHKWNIKNVFRGKGTRPEAKKRAFAWLYNPDSEDLLMDQFYDRDSVLSKYWDGAHVNTCFNRTIKADRFHALNYIVQSTCADMVLEQACKIRRLLAHKRSTIAFVVHDSVVIDLADEDRQELIELLRGFRNTRFGDFMISVSAGKNFGNLKRLKL